MKTEHKRWPARFWLLVIAAGVIAGLLLAFNDITVGSFAAFARHRQFLLATAEARPALAAGAFIALYIVAAAVSLPIAPMLTVAGGFLFGLATGTIYSVIAATLGATAAFLLVRWGFGNRWQARSGPSIRRIEERFRRRNISYLLFLRLFPFVPFWLTNVASALLGVRLPAFILTTAVGILPGTLVFVGLGCGLGSILDRGETPDLGILLDPPLLLPLLGLAALSLLPVVFPRGERNNHTADRR